MRFYFYTVQNTNPQVPEARTSEPVQPEWTPFRIRATPVRRAARHQKTPVENRCVTSRKSETPLRHRITDQTGPDAGKTVRLFAPVGVLGKTVPNEVQKGVQTKLNGVCTGIFGVSVPVFSGV